MRAESEQRQLTYAELQEILSMAIARTNYSDIALVLEEFTCDMLPATTYEDMVTTRIARGDYGLARHAASMAGRELTQHECDKVAYFALLTNSDTAQVVQMVKMTKVSPAGIKALIDICLDRAWPQIAGFLGEQVGHQFSAAEIERLHKSCEDAGFTDRLQHVYELPTLVVA